MPGCGVKSHVALVVGLCVVTESCGSRGTTCAACDVREVTSSSALKHVLRFYFTGARQRRGNTCNEFTYMHDVDNFEGQLHNCVGKNEHLKIGRDGLPRTFGDERGGVRAVRRNKAGGTGQRWHGQMLPLKV